MRARKSFDGQECARVCVGACLRALRRAARCAQRELPPRDFPSFLSVGTCHEPSRFPESQDGRGGVQGLWGRGDDRASRASQGGRCRRGRRHHIRARIDPHPRDAPARRRATTPGAPRGVAVDVVVVAEERALVLPADGAERRHPRAGEARGG